jgi:signal transduction histidine kinase
VNAAFSARGAIRSERGSSHRPTGEGTPGICYRGRCLIVSDEKWQILARRLALLNEMRDAMDVAETERDVFDLAARYTPRILDLDRAGVTLVSDDRASFRIMAFDGSEGALPSDQIFSAAESAPGHVAKTGKLLYTEDCRTRPEFAEFKMLADAGMRSMVNVPLITGGRFIGTLNGMSKTAAAFDDRDLELFGQIAAHLGSNVHGRRLHEQTKVALARAEALVDELAEARDVAMQASRAKSHFLANMSHELRTPLNAIIGYSELLREDAEDRDDDGSADLRKIELAGRHLLGLINDILDMSKIEAGKMDLYCEPFPVAELVESVVVTVQPLMGRRSNELVVDQPDGLGEMHADPGKIRQVLVNLLGNAAKFTEQGTITLRVAGGDGALHFSVIDTGIGMTAEQQARIFEPFSQATPDTSKKYGGTGLGLTLSARICELMGGALSATSEVGAGSTFTAVIPRRAVIAD